MRQTSIFDHDEIDPGAEFRTTRTRPPAPPEWFAACKVEPRLQALEARAAGGESPSFLIGELHGVVGWFADQPPLRNLRSYNLAVAMLREAFAYRAVAGGGR